MITNNNKKCIQHVVDKRNGNEIRARLLNKLGIVKHAINPSQSSDVALPIQPHRPRVPLSSQNVRHSNVIGSCYSNNIHNNNLTPPEEPLLMPNFCEVPLNSPNCCFSQAETKFDEVCSNDVSLSIALEPVSRQVRFSDIVYVQEIPNRYSYTDEEKDNLWNNAQTIFDMARKNEKEFYYEQYDWRCVVEEQDFVDIGNNILVHPSNVPVGYLERRQREEKRRDTLMGKDSCNTKTIQTIPTHSLALALVQLDGDH